MALRIMKQIDLNILGPGSPYLWKEMRKKRYSFTSPASAGFLLLPYLWPPPEERMKILLEEMHCGLKVWEKADVKINGVNRIIDVCCKWGALRIGKKLILLPESFIELTEIDNLVVDQTG